jgi:hypothetical protein
LQQTVGLYNHNHKKKELLAKIPPASRLLSGFYAESCKSPSRHFGQILGIYEKLNLNHRIDLE